MSAILAARLGMLAASLVFSGAALAHCDTLDGPVVAAARKALDTGDLNVALVWIRAQDEAEIRAVFAKSRAVRKAGGAAKELADLYFFETLVRVHRAGEGAPYTGLKPSGTVEPPIAAADRAIETGTLEPLARLIDGRIKKGLHANFDAVMTKRKYAPADVEHGRAYASAYVEFVHYAERLYGAAEALAPVSSAGHSH